MAKGRTKKKSGNAASTNGANLGFEAQRWEAADKLRNNMDAAEYKHVVLGLIFLKYISDAFQEKFDALKTDKLADPEDRDEYTAANIFWVPPDPPRVMRLPGFLNHKYSPARACTIVESDPQRKYSLE